MPITTTDTTDPPPFEGANTVELLSSKDGKITHVSLYPSRADITRLFKLPVKVGQNQVIISGLPDVLDDNSLRVEGRGAAIIQDVTISEAPRSVVINHNPRLEELLLQKEHKQLEIKRTNTASDALSTYLSTLSVSSVSPDQLQAIIDRYDVATAKLDGKSIQLKKELDKLLEDITKEQLPYVVQHPTMTATVGIFGELEGEIDLILQYAVTHAGWTPVYDIRVNTDAKEKCIKLIYKASVTQTTGETWNDIPLTLETSLPQFGVNVPTLYPWKLQFVQPQRTYALHRSAAPSTPVIVSAPRYLRSRSYSRSRSRSRSPRREAPGASMQRRVAAVYNNPNDAGAVATFEVPDLKTIPSDGAVHKVTIAELEMDAELTWVSIPSKDVRMHWKAMVHNASDYPLLKGMASIFINGSFISRSEIPYVSPQERFSCALGIDPSIRVVYHPREKKRSQTGFYSKSNNHVFTQRISLTNTKSCTVTNVKIVDHIPVSEESTLTVKLLSPALPQADPDKKKAVDMTKNVQVSKGVVAQWEKGDNDNDDAESLGSDGKLSWVCTLPAQGKVNLVLSWEIAAPADKAIVGL